MIWCFKGDPAVWAYYLGVAGGWHAYRKVSLIWLFWNSRASRHLSYWWFRIDYFFLYYHKMLLILSSFMLIRLLLLIVWLFNWYSIFGELRPVICNHFSFSFLICSWLCFYWWIFLLHELRRQLLILMLISILALSHLNFLFKLTALTDAIE